MQGSDNDPVGILIIDKEKGMTSHDVVNMVRKMFLIKKAGHAGTLDPNATGVLVLLIGKATKLSGRFLDEDKEYEGVIKLGEKTSTGDAGGEVTGTREVIATESEVRSAIESFTGEIDQVPPMFSAKRINGKKLYKLARKGIDVERESKKVTIKEIEVTFIELPLVRFRVVCSKGTYIRQLAEDIGEKLGCGAHLEDLRRMRSGRFDLSQAVPVAELKNIKRVDFRKHLLAIPAGDR